MTASLKNSSLGRIEWFTALLVTLAVVWLHLHFWQNAGGLWRDEINTLNLAQSHSFVVMSHDSFPILLALLLDGWTRLGFGDTDAGLRLAGMLFGLTIPVAFWVLARVIRRPPLFGLVMFGLNTLLISYGDSLRAYGLGSALIVLALTAMWSLLKNPSWFRAGLLALTATLSVQTLYQNSILFFGICLGGFAVCARRKDLSTAIKILCAGGVSAASLLPYYGNFTGLSKASVELRRGCSPFVMEINYEMATGYPFDQYAVVWKMLAAAVVGLALLSLIRRRPAEDVETSLPLFAGVTLAAVVVLFVVFLWYAAVGARPWYFIPLLALLAACFDCGLGWSSLPRLVHVAVFGFLIGTAAVSVPSAYQDLLAHFTNIDRQAARVAVQSSSQDYVVVTPWYCGLTFDHYFQGPAAWQTLPPLSNHQTHRYDLVLKQMLNTNSLAPVFEKISETLRSGHRVWLVSTLESLPTNAVEPAVLPPPPLPGSGWSDLPYNDSWAARTEYYLARHSVSFSPNPDYANTGIYLRENLHMFIAQGWRD